MSPDLWRVFLFDNSKNKEFVDKKKFEIIFIIWYFLNMKTLTSTTIKISDQALKRGVAFLDLDEYRRLQQAAVPTYFLTGQAAEALDCEVEEALQEDREGKTIQASSIREALAKYDAQENSKN